MNKKIIKSLINKQNPTIFEIGCADGKDTLEFISVFDEKLNIHCFEPEIKNINIVKNTINFKGHRLFEGAISDKDGVVIFNRSRTNDPNALSYSGSIKKPKNHLNIWPYIIFDNFTEVKTVTLDTYCKNNNIDFIDFIWADIQGAELDMINGGSSMFNNKVKYLYTEYSNDEIYENQASLNQILSALGPNWRIAYDFKTDVLLENFTI
jgi:FkbM family methyltransferase